MKIHCLKLKNKELNKEVAFYLTSIIRQALKNTEYKDQISSTVLPDIKIKLPIDSRGTPDWNYMERYIEREGEIDKKSTPIFYGEFKNVRLSKEEYKNLKEKLNSHTDIMINKLSRYMESSGKTYQNHYVTILKWYEEDKDKLRQKGLNKKMNYDVGESL
ncbi:phage-associated protein [Streptococcus pneumoniae]|nr:phage-associated protein [Streptococcus pneumoniae]VQD93571.1 phage-associated protein [Streptococcus pneumoniae]VQE01953.1 phage-associated protein [Streptococcus pneumoniae]VRQ92425.1 phage-associated protein [Streptococcus pneumoniae]